MKRASLLLLLLLTACNGMTAKTVLDINSAEANLVCTNDVKIAVMEQTCYDSEKIKFGVENNGKELAGLLVNNITINKTVMSGGILIDSINKSEDTITIHPIVKIREMLFICSNALEKGISKCQY